MTFYDNTKEDSRPWRTDQDTRAQAIDTAAVATATANAANKGVLTPLHVAPFSVATGATKQITLQSNVPNVQYTSSAPAKATVSASGLVTGVATGTSTITIAQVVKGMTVQSATVLVTVTA